MGPVVGAVIVVLLPELLSFLAEYRLLFVGALLLLVLRLAPGGLVGAVQGSVRSSCESSVCVPRRLAGSSRRS
jgi:ABC-type branched-subunit amino acid transport system permease subunit